MAEDEAQCHLQGDQGLGEGGEGSQDLLIQALAGLIHIWVGLELRPRPQPHGWCWH